MALVPMIQPPIIKLLTTKKRLLKWNNLEVKQTEKIFFSVSVICMTLIPSSAPIIGMLMLGNLIKESKVVPNLTKTAGESLLYIITILLGLSIGATTMGSSFLKLETLMIIGLGLIVGFGAACHRW